MDVMMRGRSWSNTKDLRLAVNYGLLGRLERCAVLVEIKAKRLLTETERQGSTRQRDEKTGKYKTSLGPSRRGQRGPASKPGHPPAIQKGILRASITHAMTWYGSFVVGPTRIAWYGQLHEFGGVVINVTEPMRRYLHAIGIHLRAETVQIHLVQRPFMRPALMATAAEFPNQFRGIGLKHNPAGRQCEARVDSWLRSHT